MPFMKGCAHELLKVLPSCFWFKAQVIVVVHRGSHHRLACRHTRAQLLRIRHELGISKQQKYYTPVVTSGEKAHETIARLSMMTPCRTLNASLRNQAPCSLRYDGGDDGGHEFRDCAMNRSSGIDQQGAFTVRWNEITSVQFRRSGQFHLTVASRCVAENRSSGTGQQHTRSIWACEQRKPDPIVTIEGIGR